jgi:DNA-binding transcriptional ArsR family regulator
MGARVSALVDAAGWAPSCRPARVNGADPELRAFVAQRRRQGASWDAVGRMLGCSGLDAREAFGGEPSVEAIGPPVVVNDAPVEPLRLTPEVIATLSMGPARHAVLQAVAGGCERAPAIGSATKVTPGAVRLHLANLLGLGLVRRTAFARYAPTAEGGAVLVSLAGRAAHRAQVRSAAAQAPALHVKAEAILGAMGKGAQFVHRIVAVAGPPATKEAVDRALYRLRRDGLVERVGRGRWILSPLGWAKVRGAGA